MKKSPSEPTNLELLERHWRRSPFHDQEIQEISALNKRVVIRLTDMTLVITDATKLERCETPTVWLYDKITPGTAGFSLDVETDEGWLRVSGSDVRLIRNNDLAVLVPPIDV
jgi:hypothetical protein